MKENLLKNRKGVKELMEKKLMAVLSVIKPQDCSHREAGLFHGICTEYIS